MIFALVIEICSIFVFADMPSMPNFVKTFFLTHLKHHNSPLSKAVCRNFHLLDERMADAAELFVFFSVKSYLRAVLAMFIDRLQYVIPFYFDSHETIITALLQ